ncbi:myosin light chain kinase A-like [Harmonia axyridis]|uniref:myosin light chain kinase A-like n=1 Tax=Harmonia axyridis TaxID=115357 RepID=UPI001E278A8E|nr:myosin light chain kinase A-like [Harmonia axyridis]
MLRSVAVVPSNPSDEEPTPERITRISGPFRKIRTLGEGGFGKVFEVEHGDIRFALKVTPKDEVSMTELRMLKAMRHPNVVRLLVDYVTDERLYLGVELMEGDLLELVQRRGPLPEGECCDMLGQAFAGLAACHAQRILHRDIKPDNCLLRGRRVCIADFGLACRLNQRFPTTSRRAGTPPFWAPEVLKRLPFGLPSDVWAMGVTALYMATGKLPFMTPNGEKKVMNLIGHYRGGEMLEVPEGLRSSLVELLRVDPAHRPSAAWGEMTFRQLAVLAKEGSKEMASSERPSKFEAIKVGESFVEAFERQPKGGWTPRFRQRLLRFRPPGVRGRLHPKFVFPNGRTKRIWVPQE